MILMNSKDLWITVYYNLWNKTIKYLQITKKYVINYGNYGQYWGNVGKSDCWFVSREGVWS